MTDEQTNPQTDQPRPTPGDAWREVGKQFEALGNSLATAFRTAWEDESTRRHMHEMQAGLEKMVSEVGQALDEAAAKPEAQKARAEAQRAAQSLRAAGDKSWQEAKPQLVSALRQLSAELQKTIHHLEQQEQAAKATTEATPDKPTGE